MRSKSHATVCVLVVTYNSAAVLPALLDSLAAGFEGVDAFEVVVVDNDSRDGSADIAMLHPIVPRVVRTGRNGGYAAGINAGCRTIDPRSHVLILNPDVRLLAGAVLPLLRRIQDPSVGIAVPRNLMPDGATDRTLRREPTVATAWAEAVLGGRLAARLGLGEIVGRPDAYDDDRSIEWATGCALLVSARVRRLVPEWDETFFLYSEEIEYQRRVRAAGLSIDYVPQSLILHIGGDYRIDTGLTALLTTNRIRYFRDYHGAIATAVFRLGIIVGALLRSARSRTQRTAFLTAVSPLRPPLSYRPEPPADGGRTS